jgi:cytochrome c oxidase subunit IV
MATNSPDAPSTHSEIEHAVHDHPGWKTYVVIGAILTIITLVEVAIFYIPAMHPFLTPVLLVLSGAKFVIVVLFYMHLKFDSRIFSGVFFAPLLLAITVVISLIILFKVLPLYQSGGGA